MVRTLSQARVSCTALIRDSKNTIRSPPIGCQSGACQQHLFLRSQLSMARWAAHAWAHQHAASPITPRGRMHRTRNGCRVADVVADALQQDRMNRGYIDVHRARCNDISKRLQVR